jgi:hypothetical protein
MSIRGKSEETRIILFQCHSGHQKSVMKPGVRSLSFCTAQSQLSNPEIYLSKRRINFVSLVFVSRYFFSLRNREEIHGKTKLAFLKSFRRGKETVGRLPSEELYYLASIETQSPNRFVILIVEM